MPRVALYARVSTFDQHPEIQLHALRTYATARGLEVVGEYVDHGVSGAKNRRPDLDRLLIAAKRREIDVLACTKLDRLARSLRHLTTLAEELEALGVDLVVLDQAIDTTTPAGRLLFNMLGAVAEFERDIARERTRAGLEAARRRGRHLGRPCALDTEKRKRLERMLGAGKSQRYVARVLGIGASTVRREMDRARERR